MKTCREIISIMIMLLLLLTCGGCADTNKNDEPRTETPSEASVVVGFSQLGAESDWRSANTESMLETFTKENGYTLIYENGQQKQSNQITAIRKFIQQDVDYIVLAPVTEKGWDSVLEEARDAGIPVIIVDRRVDVADKNLYTCWVGSDFELEAKKMCAWLKEFAAVHDIAPKDLHIVNIQGNIGSTAQIGRTRGLANAARENGWDLKEEISGDFTETRGYEVMSLLLGKYDDLNVIYCENDNMAFGVIDALEEAGKKVGSDIANGEIMVVSFDGVNEDAVRYAKEGRISCIAECNPLHGPRVEGLIRQLREGREPDKFSYVDEKIFSASDDVPEIKVDEKVYPVEKP